MPPSPPGAAAEKMVVNAFMQVQPCGPAERAGEVFPQSGMGALRHSRITLPGFILFSGVERGLEGAHHIHRLAPLGLDGVDLALADAVLAGAGAGPWPAPGRRGAC